jgi:OmcA/MtrC family decaheme c-type cytochrome
LIDVFVDNVAFGAAVGDNVPVTVGFRIDATNQAGDNVTQLIDLRTAASGSLSFVRVTLAKMVPGTGGNSDEWNVFVHKPGATGSGPYFESRLTGGGTITGDPVTGAYTYRLPDNSVRVSDGFVSDTLNRAFVEVRSVPIEIFTTDLFYQPNDRRPIGLGFVDVVAPAGGGAGTAPAPGAFPTKNSVSTAACNACHDVLAVHGGSRREYSHCQACHNDKLEQAFDNSNLVNLIHKIHYHRKPDGTVSGAQNIGELGDFSEVTYPQDVRNCTRCHQGTDADNTYSAWNTRPNTTTCGSCHFQVFFSTPAPPGKTIQHPGGVPVDNTSCANCHLPTGTGPLNTPGITESHATENSTPNNPQLPGSLVTFEYGLDEVTVDSNNVATIKFWIKQDNVFVNFGDTTIARPANFSGSPAFLFAYALPQDNIAAPIDYNNLGRAAGQPESLNIVGLPIVAKNANNSQFTVQRANAFPAGASMRAVALQSYFTQINGGTHLGSSLDNVGRHTPAVHKPVTGDAVRRVAVESGYVTGADGIRRPVGCLECHEIFEAHGGQRVSNAQTCVMCHNPNLSTSGRTITASPINPDIVALFGNNPLQYPEVPNNFKELIHGIHGAQKRVSNFVDIRNRQNGVLLQGDEITYPGDLTYCGKCHLNNLYKEVAATNRLLTTSRTTTGNASETAADITAARGTVPNATDLVNTPTTSACGHCHDSTEARSHFVSNGGKIQEQRSAVTTTTPPLFKWLGW